MYLWIKWTANWRDWANKEMKACGHSETSRLRWTHFFSCWGPYCFHSWLISAHPHSRSSLCPVSTALWSQYLLLVLVFSNCSFCLACHSSNSTLAFSFHSASCLRELSSGERDERRRAIKKWRSRWESKQQGNDRAGYMEGNYGLRKEEIMFAAFLWMLTCVFFNWHFTHRPKKSGLFYSLPKILWSVLT